MLDNALIAAAGLGLLTAIAPCPLATNIAMISFLAQRIDAPWRGALTTLAYILGRTAAYVGLAALLTAGLLATGEVASWLQVYLNRLLGPLLIVVGMVLLGLLPLPTFGQSAKLQAWRESLAKRGGLVGGFLLGVLFAMSFCPPAAALYFGSLLPLAVKADSMILVPGVYGLATALPVVAFALLLLMGSRYVSQTFDRVQAVSRVAKWGTGVFFIALGLYYALTMTLMR